MLMLSTPCVPLFLFLSSTIFSERLYIHAYLIDISALNPLAGGENGCPMLALEHVLSQEGQQKRKYERSVN
jgi:hypothetical protein